LLSSKLRQLYVAAVNGSDAGAYVKTLTDDIVLMPPDTPRVTGKQAVASWIKTAFFDRYSLEFDFSWEEIQEFGTHAVVSGPFSLKMTPKSGGESVAVKGKFLDLCRKDSDGAWKFARGAWNFDAPVGGAK
jgi:ketosteroid isomerase-like protein